jgi:site-specific recombinase XerD
MSTDDNKSRDLGKLIEVTQPLGQSLAEAVGSPSEDTVGNLLSQAMPFLDDPILGAIVPWFCDKLGSDLSIKDYRRDLSSFRVRMKDQGVDPLSVTGNHVRIYKKTLDKAGARSASISRYLSVIRGVYRQLAIHGQVPWDVAQDIQAIEGPEVQKNSTPALTSKQAQQLLDAIPTQTLKGKRDMALMWTYIITACRVSAIIRARGR